MQEEFYDSHAKALYGLIGYPVSHSLSPLMHNAAFKLLDVNASYELFSLEEQQLQPFFEDLKDPMSTVFGLNVTVPYKEKVIPFMDSVSPFVDKVKAVNTVVITKERKLIGHNTDGPGFMAHLKELNVEVADKKIVIVGTGGAARAIISVLCLLVERPKYIKIYDIDREKSFGLLFDLSQRLNTEIVEVVNSIDALEIQNADILINSTPIGMKDTDPLIIPEEKINSELFVYDLVYNPAETKLLAIAKSKRAKVSNGLGMLFYQGVLAFQHWADMELEDDIKQAMKEALEQGLYGKKES